MTIEIAGLPNPDYAAILIAALEAVNPFDAVKQALKVTDTQLTVAGNTLDFATLSRVLVLGAGKAAAPMAEAVELTLTDAFNEKSHATRLSGMVVTKYEHGLEDDEFTLLGRVRIVEAAHPVPDASGLAAGEEILRIAESAQQDDLVIVVLSGGGSALLEALPQGIALEDLQATTSLMLASGATINELNTIRKHLSRIKGGQFARAIAPARMITLVLSDVVGSPLDVIASGPTVPDSSTWRDVGAILDKHALWQRLPVSVSEHIQRGLAGTLAETPKASDACFEGAVVEIVGDNRAAAFAAQVKAVELGFDAEIVTNALEGEASQVARQIVANAIIAQGKLKTDAPAHRRTALLIYGGETTVTLGDNPGKGGRNQELALAAALALEGTQGITLITLATDGTDGPTDAAGGCVDGETLQRARNLGLDAHRDLATHNAYPFLQRSGNLLVTGPTRTNVNDLIFVFIEPNE